MTRTPAPRRTCSRIYALGASLLTAMAGALDTLLITRTRGANDVDVTDKGSGELQGDLNRSLSPATRSEAPPPTTRSPTDVHSSLENKITLTRSLFRGREDVYAVRWTSARTGKTGYSLAVRGGLGRG